MKDTLTTETAIELIYKAMPYGNQVTNLDLTSYSGGIAFTWRGTRFLFTYRHLSFEEIGNGVLTSSDMCIVMSALFKNIYYKNLMIDFK